MKQGSFKEKALKYQVNIYWSEEDQAYLARVPELKGCVTHGDTYEHAAKMAQEAIELYLESLSIEKVEPPVPLSERHFSGKIPFRTTPNLHRDLAIKAEMEGLSLNKYIEKKLGG